MNMNIGEASVASGISRKMIRYYEEIGLLKPVPRTNAGYRLYTDNCVQQLRFIKRARDLGFSLERIKTLLDLWQNTDRQSADVKALAQQYMAELDQNIMQLQAMANRLALFLMVWRKLIAQYWRVKSKCKCGQHGFIQDSA